MKFARMPEEPPPPKKSSIKMKTGGNDKYNL